MRKTLKMVSQFGVALVGIALWMPVANAQIDRTFTLTCKNLGNVGAQITSWTWVQENRAPIGTDATVGTTKWNCAGGGFFTTTLTQPVVSDAGWTAGVQYTIEFTNGSTLSCDFTGHPVNIGQPVHFHDRCVYTGPGAPNNAVAVAVLGR